MKRDYPDRPIVGVGAVVVEKNRVVVVKRGKEPLKGQWSIPGGAVELGETLREAVAREAREELGLAVEPGVIVEVFDSIYRDPDGRPRFHYVLVDFVCRRLSGELCAASDISEARWVTLQDLPELKMTSLAEKVIRKALQL